MDENTTGAQIKLQLHALSAVDWDELEALYKQVAAHKGMFGELIDKGQDKNGVRQMPYVSSERILFELMRYFYDKKLVVNFDWGGWDEGREMFKREGDDRFDDISVEETLKLLTAIMRNDRFNEGAWVNLFDSGDGKLLLAHLLSFRTRFDQSKIKPPTRPAIDAMIENLHAKGKDDSKTKL